MTSEVPVASSSAAVSGAYRPTTVAPSSSARPASSSARVCRTTVKIAISPASAAPIAPILNSETAPIDVSSNTRPYRASVAGVLFTACAALTRDSTVE